MEKWLFIGFLLIQNSLWAQEEKVTSASNVQMTVNRIGLIGNAFKGSYSVLGYPSCEYPKNSGVEHLFEGGLWVGAKVNGSVVVTTMAIDDASGYTTGKEGFEVSTELGAVIQEKSTLLDNPNYNPVAISHQDFITQFTDKYSIVPGTTVPIANLENGPLYYDGNLETYNWNYSFADFFVILNYTITNNSTNTWSEPWFGIWIDPVVRNVNVTPAGSGGTNFYNKSGTGYIDSLYCGYEFDVNGDPGYTNSYIGTKFLGSEFNNQFYHPALDTSFKAYFNAWTFRDFTSAYRMPANDNERYQKLSSGLNVDANWANLQNNLKTAGNRSQLVSVGPYPSIAPGQSVNIVFAIVLAKKFDDGQATSADTYNQKYNLRKNAGWAQAAYNGEDANFNGILDPGEDRDLNGKITRYILPSSPDIPKHRYVVEDKKVRLYWTNNSEFSIDPISRRQDFEGYRVYKTKVGFDVAGTQDILSSLQLVGSYDKTGNGIGYDNGFTSIKLSTPYKFSDDTTQYHYMIEFNNLLNGWQHAFAITSFDEGEPENNLESLESSLSASLKRIFPGMPANKGFSSGDPFVYPNPYYGGASWEGASTQEESRKIIFANLPPKCDVRIYTVSGDLVYTFSHEEAYNGSDTPWFNTYSEPKETQMSGGEHSWNLLSSNNQIIARGIYLFAVKDTDTGEVRRGKFVVIK